MDRKALLIISACMLFQVRGTLIRTGISCQCRTPIALNCISTSGNMILIESALYGYVGQQHNHTCSCNQSCCSDDTIHDPVFSHRHTLDLYVNCSGKRTCNVGYLRGNVTVSNASSFYNEIGYRCINDTNKIEMCEDGEQQGHTIHIITRNPMFNTATEHVACACIVTSSAQIEVQGVDIRLHSSADWSNCSSARLLINNQQIFICKEMAFYRNSEIPVSMYNVSTTAEVVLENLQPSNTPTMIWLSVNASGHVKVNCSRRNYKTADTTKSMDSVTIMVDDTTSQKVLTSSTTDSIETDAWSSTEQPTTTIFSDDSMKTMSAGKDKTITAEPWSTTEQSTITGYSDDSRSTIPAGEDNSDTQFIAIVILVPMSVIGFVIAGILSIILRRKLCSNTQCRKTSKEDQKSVQLEDMNEPSGAYSTIDPRCMDVNPVQATKSQNMNCSVSPPDSNICAVGNYFEVEPHELESSSSVDTETETKQGHTYHSTRIRNDYDHIKGSSKKPNNNSYPQDTEYSQIGSENTSEYEHIGSKCDKNNRSKRRSDYSHVGNPK